MTLAIIQAIAAASGLIGRLVDMSNRLAAEGKITAEELASIKAAAKRSDPEWDALVHDLDPERPLDG